MERAKLHDVCLKIYSGGTPSTAHPEYWDGIYPWLSSGETSNSFIKKSEKHITQVGIDNSTTKFAPRGATIIASAGEGKTRGQCSYLLIDAYVNQSLIVLIANETKILKEYLYYYLKSKYSDMRSLSNATGVRGSLSCSLIGEMIVEYPTIPEQKKIVATLFGLDEQIQRNYDMVHKLQVLAQTTYSRWFNQFEFPNEHGLPYKSNGGKMIWNNELKREIPEGWSVLKLKDCVEHISTGLNPRDNFVLNDGEIRYVTVKNLTANGTLDFVGCDAVCEKTKELINKRSKINTGDILYASIAPLGRCYLIQEEPKSFEINESVFSIRANNNLISSEYLYMILQDDYFNKKALNSAMGSIFKGIRINILNDFDIVVPMNHIITAFASTISTYLKLLFLLSKENEQLRELKRALLPLLINGQLKV